MARYEHVMSAFSMGGRHIRNRVLITGHSVLYGIDGAFSQRHVDYYVERARGGAAIVITEQQAAHPVGRNYRAGLKAYDTANMAAWRQLTGSVQAHGALVYAQLFCGGPQGSSTQYMDDWSSLHSPSGIRSTQFGEIPAVLTESGIAEIREGFVKSAVNMKLGGFDGIEIHAAHSQLLGSFLSPAFNRREDNYGGSAERRCRIVLEVLEAVRDAVGAEMHIGLRLGASEYLGDAGLQQDEAFLQAMIFARSGLVNFLDISAGGYFAKSVSVPPMASELPTGFLAGFTSRLMAEIPRNVAVFSVGRITTLEQADRLIADGSCDMVGMTRAHIADPYLIEKSLGNHAKTQCIGANVCAKRLVGNLPVACVLNPRMGRERKTRQLRNTESSLRVVVAGAGPAGLRAAVTAARLGHRVILVERSDSIGGRLLTLARLPLRQRWMTAIEDLRCELDEGGVEVRLGETADRGRIEALAPDLTLVATGSEWELTGETPFRPGRQSMKGVEQEFVRRLGLDEAVLVAVTEPHALGRHVVILDETFDSTAAALAIMLGEAGVKVSITTPAPSYAEHLFQTYELPYFMKRLEDALVSIHTGITLDEIGFGGAVLTSSLYSARQQELKSVDTIVFAAGRKPSTDLSQELAAADLAHRVIGDALAPRAIEAVFYDGFAAAASLSEREIHDRQSKERV